MISAERWRRDATGLGEPQLITDTTLVLLWEGTLSALSTVDGSTLWTLNEPLGSPLMNNVVAMEPPPNFAAPPTLYVAVYSRPWGD